MARASVPKSYFNFIGGKHSDGNPLASPEGTARILSNVDLDVSGKISRRLGIDYEDSFVLDGGPFTESDIRNSAVNYFEWKNADNSSSDNFLVIRVGNTLYIYDEGTSPLSNGLLDTIDISSFATNPPQSKSTEIQGASGKGLFFIVGEKYNPFFIQFDSDTDTFSTSSIEIEIRDFEDVDDGLDLDEQPITLSNAHRYNLINQGWSILRVNSFKAELGRYPSNVDIEHLGFRVNNDGNREFSPREITNYTLGNTRAPRGHVIINAFEKDREAATGITGLPEASVDERPRAVAFYSSRVWYASSEGNVFFSQIIENTGNIGKCYQEQDPTAEDFNELVDTDGGVIPIPESGTVLKMVSTSVGLVVFATGGIWLINGADTTFTANNTSNNKISDVVLISPKSVVVAEDTVFFWSEEGIYVLAQEEISGTLIAKNITDNRINNDFKNISQTSKALAQGGYDRVNKKIYWSYNDGLLNVSNNILGKYDSIVVYDLVLNAFYDYRIENSANNIYQPYMAGIVKRASRNAVSQTETVTVGGAPVTVNGTIVTTTVIFDSIVDHPIKVLTFAPTGSSTFKLTFSEFCSRSFKDWFAFDSTGANYTSIIETNPETLGDGMFDKQATYLFTFYDFKRDGFNSSSVLPDRVDPGKGFRTTQNVIEIIRRGNPGQAVTQNVIEVLRRGLPKARSTQHVIEIVREV